MRTKQIAMALLLCSWIHAVKSSTPLNELLVPRMDFKSADNLNGLELDKKILGSGAREYLFITKDYGSGLKLLEIFLYRKSVLGWDLEFFSRTKCGDAQAIIEKEKVRIVCAGKDIFISGGS
jgi:hypothetical protein